MALPWAPGRASTSRSLLADGMTYYSCADFCYMPPWRGGLCGPRGIRTPDLLNAIETRSQLRYGPGIIYDLDFRLTILDADRTSKTGIVNLWT